MPGDQFLVRLLATMLDWTASDWIGWVCTVTAVAVGLYELTQHVAITWN